MCDDEISALVVDNGSGKKIPPSPLFYARQCKFSLRVAEFAIQIWIQHKLNIDDFHNSRISWRPPAALFPESARFLRLDFSQLK